MNMKVKAFTLFTLFLSLLPIAGAAGECGLTRDCLDASATLASVCNISDQVFAWYTGDTFDVASNIWYDQSGSCRNVESQFIDGTIALFDDFNDENYVTGTTSTRVYFPYEVLPYNYTFFHVSRYFDGAEDIIFQAFDWVFYSGFYNGISGVAQHETVITDENNDRFGRQWFISTDLRNEYRTNGVDRTKSIQTDNSDIAHQYRLAINNGYFGTDDSSDWAVAEIIVFDRELRNTEYKCVEQHLAEKYNLEIYSSPCQSKSPQISEMEEQCEVLPTFAVYDGSSYDADTNVWSDLSGQCRNVDDYLINGDIAIHEGIDGLNNRTYISGTTTTTIEFPVEVLPLKYTFFHVARYNDGTEGRIFQSYPHNYFSGFHNGKSGCAFRSGTWITSSTADLHGTDWVLSTDQVDTYRSNGVSRQTTIRPDAYWYQRYRLTVNNGVASAEISDFAIAEIIVFEDELTPKQYKCVEQYLSDKYNITVEPTPCANESLVTNPYTSQCDLSAYDLLAWYDGSSFDSDAKVWYDLSGQCNNVDSQYIGGIVTTYDNFNDLPYITGTTSTTISFPYNLLPLQYTFFHVARYFGTEGRIFQAFDHSFISGFYNGYSGVALHDNWLTPSNIDLHGNSWVLSSDQRSVYRSQGRSRTTDDQGFAYSSWRYRLSINTGVSPTEDSAFAVAEMLVFDGELSTAEIKCVEEQLSGKYAVINTATACQPKNDSLSAQCGLRRDTFAWYQGHHFDDTESTWFDDSGFCRNIDAEYIAGTITAGANLNGHPILQGSTLTRMDFPYDVLPVNYTLFHVTKYNDGAEDIIFQAYDYPWLSGFYQGYAGVAHHEEWITSSTTDSHGTTWVLSTDQRSLYRSNGVPRMTNAQGLVHRNNQHRLAINRGYYGTDDSSDWALAEVIVFDYELAPDEYQCVEQYLAQKYDIPTAAEVACNELSTSNQNILSVCDVEQNLFAWYDGSSYDFSENAWFDLSGSCRNVESEFITGTINIGNDLNALKYLSGTTSTSIVFPPDVLPISYTFLHVAKFDNGAENRIFQAMDYDFLSGFSEAGNAGVAYHNNWITPNVDQHGTDWVISTDSRSLYRSNGVSRMTDNQSPGYVSYPYQLAINTGYRTGTTYTSDWAVAEIIVFDTELSARQYTCMEAYLADKYEQCVATTAAPTITESTDAPTSDPAPTVDTCLSAEDLTLREYECKSADTTHELYTQCGLEQADIFAWYDGSSYSSALNEWFDISGNCRNVKDEYVAGTISTHSDLNDERYLSGTVTSKIDFPFEILPLSYTMFHVAKYNDGTEGRIFQAYDYDFCSGFWSGNAGVALHSVWITPSSVDLHGREWVISTDQRGKYRSDGKLRTRYGEGNLLSNYANQRYRLSVNNGARAAEVSDWAIAELIVVDKELNDDKIKCVENYLSVRYDESVYESSCTAEAYSVERATLLSQCAIGADNLFAWYSGNSYDESTNIWYDKSLNCRNVDSAYIDGVLNVQTDLNTRRYVNGSTSTSIQFPFEILPQEYTFMHVARYHEDGTQGRIFQSNKFDWLSGFYAGNAGVAHHENWVTASSTDYHGTGWVIATDQRSLFRSNGVLRSTTWQSPSYWNHRYELAINTGLYISQPSDFDIADVLVFNTELLPEQYKCVEGLLSDQYDISIVEPSSCLANDESTFQTQCDNLLDLDLQPFAWYDGSSYSFADNVWYDKSSNCRNVESEHITGNVFIQNDLNGEKYLTGTTSSRMEFPYEILPKDYTFIHVAKWISTATGRIFNGLDYHWWSGFNELYVMDMSAYHENWITPSAPGTTASAYVKDWVISTDARNLYRANGEFKMTDDQAVGYKNNRYRIGLNKGFHPATDARYGDWAVAEILVFDRELEPVEYKCIESYLSTKYNVSISATRCANNQSSNDTEALTQQCQLHRSPYVHYNGDSFDEADNVWYDNSKYCRNIDSHFITNSLTHITNDPYNEMNGQSYVVGSTSSRIAFPFELLPTDYNLFYVAKYNDGAEDIVFEAYDYYWFSGFYSGASGVAHHEQWISANVDTFGRQWFVANDQRSLFRANGMAGTLDTQSVSYAANRYRLAINQGLWGTSRASDFALAEMLVFDFELDSKQYKCVEDWLCAKYNKVCSAQTAVLDFEQVDSASNNGVLLSDQCGHLDMNLEQNIVAWFNGDSYDQVENIWYDQSGYGRNVDSSYLNGDIDVQSSLNRRKFINGSTSTTIDFPFDLLPTEYTLVHVAKYHGTSRDRIFQSYDYTFTSGFTNGLSGSAVHENWITSSSIDQHGDDWVLSTDQRNLYRSNGEDRMTNDQDQSYESHRYILTINNGQNGGEDSDFAVAEVIVFNTELSAQQYKCVEEWLASKYNMCLPVPPVEIMPTEAATTTAPTVAPVTAAPTSVGTPTMTPTLPPNGTCAEQGLIKELRWSAINASSVDFEFSMSVDYETLGLSIEIITDYLGTSYDWYGEPIGTAYVFDFAPFDSYNGSIDEPGTCANRLYSSYTGKSFAEYWEYSTIPYVADQLGSTDFLAYGPLPGAWSLSSETECTKVRYSGVFTWDELRNCQDVDGNSLLKLETDAQWINMTGRFYMSVVSPLLVDIDIGYYVHDVLVSYPVKLSIQRSVHILNSAGINVFIVTIFQSRRLSNEEDGTGNTGGYLIILSSQTSDYLQLTNPNLVSSPSEYSTWTVSAFYRGLNGECYINAADGVCMQFWKIEILDLDCPVSFAGSFEVEWTTVCNPNNVDDTQCNSYLSTYSSRVSVGTPEFSYADQFACNVVNVTHVAYSANMNFHASALFAEVDNTLVYRAGTDKVYVEISVADLPAALAANLLNVWLCAAVSETDDGTAVQIEAGNEIASGCFDLDLVDADTFTAIILNQEGLLYNAQIYETANVSNNRIRFSFTAPIFPGKDFIYVHSELELLFNNGSSSRRRLLATSAASDSVYDFLHLSGGLTVEIFENESSVPPEEDGDDDADDDDDDDDGGDEKPKQEKIPTILILAIVLGVSVVVISALITKVYCKNEAAKGNIVDENAAEIALADAAGAKQRKMDDAAAMNSIETCADSVDDVVDDGVAGTSNAKETDDDAKIVIASSDPNAYVD